MGKWKKEIWSTPLLPPPPPPLTTNPALWSISMIACSLATLSTSVPAATALSVGSLAVAICGGGHKDFRTLRGDFSAEGKSPPADLNMMSNLPMVNLLKYYATNQIVVPFADHAITTYWGELQGVNALLGAGGGGMLFLRRFLRRVLV